MTNRSHSAITRANVQRGDTVAWVGCSCGRHGSYIFYKAFRFRIANPSHQATSTSNVVVRSRSRDRRNNHCDADVTRPGDDNEESTKRDAEERILALGEFFFVQCRPEDPVCVGELQLLWHDKQSGQDLSSTRLYYLPETTPAGRCSQHGEDEMLAVSEKIVMRTSDLASWIVEPEEWNYGSSLPLAPVPPNGGLIQPTKAPLHRYSLLHSSVNMTDVKIEKKSLSIPNDLCPTHSYKGQQININESVADSNRLPRLTATSQESQNSCKQCAVRDKAEVIMLSMSSYCRHKAIMKRIEGTERDWLSRPATGQVLGALGAFTTENPQTRIVFCRDTFDYPQLFEHDLICEELAPVFKGRPRKKTKKSQLTTIKSQAKKNGVCGGIRTGVFEHPSSNDKIENDPSTPTRRSSNRRRSKRKSPLKAYEDQFVPALSRSAKRSRRGSTRTPTPVSETTKEKVEASSRSEPTSPTDPFTPNQGTTSAGGTTTKRKSKRRSGQRSSASALSIALKNSLLENHKIPESSADNRDVDDSSENKKVQRSNSVSSSSESTTSSRSCSPSTELLFANANAHVTSFKAPSPTDSISTTSSSNDPYANSSPTSSPVDFSAIMTTSDEANIKREFDLPTSEANMYLRGLNDGQLPENKSAFLELLYQFMRKRNTPIGRIPSLGFKKLDLWAFFKLSQEYGGYNMVTAKRLWKHVYDRMGGNPSCTSAATCTRKHFEKLLLPLEIYLRQTLRNKEVDVTKTKVEPDDVGKMTKSETFINNRSPLNGRTLFNGDAYFHNCPTINNASTEHDVDALAPSSESWDKPDSVKRRVTQNAASIVTSAPFANLESLVHSVIQEELRPDRSAKTEAPRDGAPEDLSLNGKLEIFETQKETTKYKPEVIDLTEPITDQHPANHAHPVHKTPFTDGVIMTMSHHTPAMVSPQSYSIPSRTHCPRISGAPPPFIPTRSSHTSLPCRPEASSLTRPYVNEHNSPVSRDANVISGTVGGQKVNQDATPDRLRLQKRHQTDDYDQGSTSCVSPKRQRPTSSLTTPSPSNGRYDIRNLISSDDKPHDKIRDHRPHTSYDNPRVKTEARGDGFDSRLCRPNEVRYIINSDSRPINHFDRRTVTDVQHSRRNVHDVDTQRQEHANPIVVRKRTPSPSARFFHPPEETNRTKDRSYYRPTGMLAKHKMTSAKQHRDPTNGIMKDRALDHHHVNDLQLRRQSNPGDIVLNGQHPRTPTNRDPHHTTQNPVSQSPKMTLQRPVDTTGRKAFSSSFTVDRLTSDTHKRHSVPNGVVTPLPQRESGLRTPHSTPVGSSKAYTPNHVYSDRRAVPYTPQSDKERNYSNSSKLLPRKDETPHRPDRPPWDMNKDLHNGPSRAPSLSSTVSSSPSDKASGSVRAMLETLPPAVARAVHPFITKDCTPQMLQRLMQEAVKVIGAPQTGVPPVPGLHLPHGQIPGLQEAMLRQQMSEIPFHIITHQEQQAAAAAQLARAAMIGSQPSGADPVTMAMYHAQLAQLASFQQTAARQLQDSGTLSNAGSIAKHGTNTDMLNHLARISAPPIQEVRYPAVLPTTPQLVQHVPPEMAAALAYSYARR